ncbi:hypothetical protein P7K49_028504 [Saguinus oedipus]|uniref:Uncharacterized protein n=1 Tax=Saguinus oedipus TaxID=9490 RepID=A0ABQ9U5A5_SAGOE|nr:hypothetical protein P7K49_028493 [Saguinus oedipus]KAK2091976.1 hypothetical protein P7K49_028504 [Saguinus oedipus]
MESAPLDPCTSHPEPSLVSARELGVSASGPMHLTSRAESGVSPRAWSQCLWTHAPYIRSRVCCQPESLESGPLDSCNLHPEPSLVSARERGVRASGLMQLTSRAKSGVSPRAWSQRLWTHAPYIQSRVCCQHRAGSQPLQVLDWKAMALLANTRILRIRSRTLECSPRCFPVPKAHRAAFANKSSPSVLPGELETLRTPRPLPLDLSPRRVQ